MYAYKKVQALLYQVRLSLQVLIAGGGRGLEENKKNDSVRLFHFTVFCIPYLFITTTAVNHEKRIAHPETRDGTQRSMLILSSFRYPPPPFVRRTGLKGRIGDSTLPSVSTTPRLFHTAAVSPGDYRT